MSKRSTWKGPFIDFSLFSDFLKTKSLKKKKKRSNIRTKSRHSTILPAFVGHIFLVYNGKSYIPVKIKSNMIGYKLGEFSSTRKRHIYKQKGKKKK